MSVCCEHLAAKGEQRRLNRPPRTSFPNAGAPTDGERKNLLIAYSDPDFSTGSTGVRLSRLMRLPEAAAVQEQIDAIIRPGIELSLGRRRTEAEGAALGQ